MTLVLPFSPCRRTRKSRRGGALSEEVGLSVRVRVRVRARARVRTEASDAASRSCSMKYVDQESGTDKDPFQVQYEADKRNEANRRGGEGRGGGGGRPSAFERG